MPHTITFVRPYKSITGINTIELPNLTVITGANGSGKSHLLQAMKAGCVTTTETPDFRKQINLFDWNNIVPEDSGSYSIGSRTAKVDEYLKGVVNSRIGVLASIQQTIESHFQERDIITSLEELEVFSNPNGSQYLHSDQERNIAENVRGWMPQFGGYFWNNVPEADYALKQRIKDIWRDDYRLLMFGGLTKIREGLITAEDLSVSLFGQAFSKIFVDYMHRKMMNNLAKSNGREFLSEDEFIRVHQIPPWEFVNNILEKSRLPFRINSPDQIDFLAAYEPKLNRTDSASELRFSDLSSGEKVLMSFALCVYNATGNNQFVFPKLLLLDEVDAPLHPEMVGVMLDVVQDILVDKYDIKVVLTTHKPTTVALAPDKSIYHMVPCGPKLTPISREKAVSVLTVGVPTMAFTTDMRLQVFTESSIDAAVFGKMYQIFKSDLSGNRSIEFIQSGRKVSSQDRDSGSSRVIDLVDKLRVSGASTILGLVDWDGKNNGTKWVHVLCQGSRYSIENLFLDPVILIVLLAKDFRGFSVKIGLLEASDAYTDLLRWNVERWQVAIDHVETYVFGSLGEKTIVKYVNGMSLSVSKQLLTMRGHDLVELLREKLHVLDRYPGDKLLARIADDIVPDVKSLIPSEILETMERIIDLAVVEHE